MWRWERTKQKSKRPPQPPTHIEKHPDAGADWCAVARVDEEFRLVVNTSRHSSICHEFLCFTLSSREVFSLKSPQQPLTSALLVRQEAFTALRDVGGQRCG